MKRIDYKRAIIAAIIVWILGVTAFLISFSIPVMEDPEWQATLVLSIVLIPAALIGANYYYKKGLSTNGFLLGGFMFLLTILLDAGVTVPLFIIPAGGSHLAFFSDPGFWMIGVIYVSVIGIYGFWRTRKLLRVG